MKKYTGLEIAVIGMSGKFPKADSIKRFWENIKNGVEAIDFFTEEELKAEGETQENIENPSYVSANAYLENKAFFDANFFGYLPDEAKVMDPQMRLFHECVWEALEDAGCNTKELKNKVGLFAGASSNLNWQIFAELANKDNAVNGFAASQLSDVRFMASKVAYNLNLRGPSIFMDTACSTSLVAIHEACKSLLLADCNIAIAGGSTVTNKSKKGYLYSEGMILSKDGHCKAFDSEASGTITSEGVGVVVLKTLKNALKDGDNIHAIIKGSAVNNDGNNKVGYTAPSVEGQAEVILKAQKWAKVTPESISLLEAHGTGTKLGDPIEFAALSQVFGKNNTKHCALGSVKTNIGHADIAAGMAGFIKSVMALKK